MGYAFRAQGCFSAQPQPILRTVKFKIDCVAIGAEALNKGVIRVRD